MPLPAPLSRANPRLSKKDFGSVLIIAGSPAMLGACALSSLAAMRCGAGMVTAAVPQSLNSTLQKKIANVIMTFALPETKTGAFSFKALELLKENWKRFDAVAIGPGIGRDPSTQKLAREVIVNCPRVLVVDADALFALAGHTSILLKAKAIRVLTPHAGEMSRLIDKPVAKVEADRFKIAPDFAKKFGCVLLLKGHQTLVVQANTKPYVNTSGNVGMATAGSGDVLTGMITSLLGQGLVPFEAAKWGAYLHGKAGDRAARTKSKAGMIASDIIESIPFVLKNV